MEQRKFQTFEDLETYKLARAFRKAMYAVSRKLPSFEKFELASQIRRASVSLTNNIAEGHGRWHYLDHIKFILQARGSLEELVDDVNVCEDEQYLPPSEIAELKQQASHVRRLIRKTGNSFDLHEDSIRYADTDDDLELWLANLPISPT